MAGVHPPYALLLEGASHLTGVVRGTVEAGGGGKAEHVQAAHHRGYLPAQSFPYPLDNVDDAAVGAGVEDYQAVLPLQNQGVLMDKVVGNKLVGAQLAQQIGLPAGKGAAVNRLGYQP